MGCGEVFMKVVLVVINIIFFLASGLMLAFGITGKADSDLIEKIFDKTIPQGDQDHMKAIGINLTQIVVDNSTFMIIVGCVGLAISLFGLIGACCMVRWMLVVYAIVLILLLLGEVALIIFAAVYSDSFKDTFQTAMKKTLTEGFKKEITININGSSLVLPEDLVELSWATIQLKYNCCGAYNYSDYNALTNWNRTIGPTPTYSNASVPISCCATKTGLDDPGKATRDSFTNLDLCIQGVPAFINQQSCYNALSDEISKFIRDYKGIAIGIAAGICGLELILIVFAFCLCSLVGKGGSKYV